MAEMALEDAPRKARESFDKGFSAFERGNLDYAMDMFEAALEIAPQLLKARRYLRAAAIKKIKGSKPGGFAKLFGGISGLGPSLQVQSQIKKKPRRRSR
jgi:hypothetical protein